MPTVHQVKSFLKPWKYTISNFYIQECPFIAYYYNVFTANYLEVEVCNPITHTDERGKRYTDYEVRMRTNLPVFK